MGGKKEIKKSFLQFEISLGGVSLIQKSLFAKHLSVMLMAGIPITEALNIISHSAKGKFKKVLKGVSKSVQSGQSLSESFSLYPEVFSGLFIGSINAGESSGTLDENLTHISEQLEKEKELKSKVKGALIYPIVVIIAALLLGLAIAFFILPKITPLFAGLGVDLPLTTRMLIWFSDFIQNHGGKFLTGIVLFILGMSWLLKQKYIKPVTHWLILKIPVINEMVRQINIARFCRILGTLLKSGLNINEALDITGKTLGNYYYRKIILTIGENIGKGASLSENLDDNEEYFPEIVTRMIKVGEESGKLDESLAYLAHFYETEVDNTTKSLTIAIEPVLLIFVGVAVGFLALSIITPIYQITGNIKR